MIGILVGSNSLGPGHSSWIKKSSTSGMGEGAGRDARRLSKSSNCLEISPHSWFTMSKSSSSPKRSSNDPLMKPESVLGICGNTGLDGHGGLDRMVGDGGLVLIIGGEEPIFGGVSAGL
jgi:hypothetical protein